MCREPKNRKKVKKKNFFFFNFRNLSGNLEQIVKNLVARDVGKGHVARYNANEKVTQVVFRKFM